MRGSDVWRGAYRISVVSLLAAIFVSVGGDAARESIVLAVKLAAWAAVLGVVVVVACMFRNGDGRVDDWLDPGSTRRVGRGARFPRKN